MAMSGNEIDGIAAFDNIMERLLTATTEAERDRGLHEETAAKLSSTGRQLRDAQAEVVRLKAALAQRERQKSWAALQNLRTLLRVHGQWSSQSTLAATISGLVDAIKLADAAIEHDDEIPF